MTTTYHTAIATGAAANASTFNSPFGQLDAALGTEATTRAAADAALVTSLATVQDAVILGGAAVTLTNGAANAAQKVVTVDSSAQFVAGCYVEYQLVGGVVERNTVDTVDSGTQLTLITNIGTGGIANNSPVAVIPIGAYNAQAGIFNVLDYGAVGDNATDDTTAIQAAIEALRAAQPGRGSNATLRFMPGKYYKITDSLDFTNIDYAVVEGGGAFVSSYGLDGKAAWDMLGSSHCLIDNLNFTSDATDPPSCHILMARCTTAGGENGVNTLSHCQFLGYWTTYAVYNVSSELASINDCFASCLGPTTCKGGFYYSASNDHSITSAYATIHDPTGASTIQYRSTHAGCAGTVTAYVPFEFGADVDNVRINDCFVDTYNNSPAVRTNGNITTLYIDGLGVESAPDKVIHFAAKAGAGTQKYINLSNISFGAEYANDAVYQDAGTTMYNLTIANCNGAGTGAVSAMTFAGTVYYADIRNWWTQPVGTLDFNALYLSSVMLADHTLTVTTDNDNTYIRHGGTYPSTHLPSLRVGELANAAPCTILRVLRHTDNINVGDVTAATSVRRDFAQAAIQAGDCIVWGTDKIAADVQITVVAYAGGGIINIYNHGASTWEAGTVAFTITAFRVAA